MSSEIKVFPNPSNGEFNLTLNDGNTYNVLVKDAVGRILLSYSHVEGNLSFGSDLDPGIYLLTVNLENKP
ncbi:MAG: T9SS type A sorting domain-containing protein [Chitinophagales bacterium]|nr:T9SS type A sorting domain-containing protein [Chitinophagales bacterium]